MRICLVVHGFPPHELAGVEAYSAGLARALVRAGHWVDVFAVRADPVLPDLSMRRELRDGYRIHWLNGLSNPRTSEEGQDPPGRRQAFERFLDRVRPEVVHFQHVVKLGLGLIEAALDRGIPSLYTAHDYHGVCHRQTLLKPDLTRCGTLGDSAICARCDVGLSVLNGYPELGDYQIGILEEQLDAAAHQKLGAALEGLAGEPFFSAEAWAQAIEGRRALDQRRAQVFGRLPVILAPTRFLRERLIDGGLDGDRIQVLPYGIDTGHLTRLAAPDPTGRPLRVGYIGTATKHKGILTLLAAFDRVQKDPLLTGRMELVLHGDSTDRVFVERLQQIASEVGARWAGRYQPDRLPEVLEDLDLIVVPSVWVENQPLVIREAFAAHRPVVTSRLGALPESVCDGVDGLLFEPGDAEDLARVLARFVEEPGLYAQLQAGLPKIKDADTQAEELLAIYRQLGAGALEPKLPGWSLELPHLAPLAIREQSLRERPLEALFSDVLGGLDGLRIQFRLPPPDAAALIAAALGPKSRVEEALGDGSGERDHLRSNLAHRDLTLGIQAREIEYLRGEFQAARLELSSQAEQQAALAQEKARERAWMDEQLLSMTQERDWLAGLRTQLESEALHQKTQAAQREEELAWRRQQEQEHIAALDRLEAHLKELSEHLDQRHQEIHQKTEQADRLSQLLSDAESRAGRAAAAIRTAEERSGTILERVHRTIGPLSVADRSGEDASHAGRDHDSMLNRIDVLSVGLDRLQEELQWRRNEMEALTNEVGRGLMAWLKLGKPAAARRAEGWRPSRSAVPEAAVSAPERQAKGPADGIDLEQEQP